MTSVYLISNNRLLSNEIIYEKEMPEELKKERIPLSFKGEKQASELKNKIPLSETKAIYSSPYLSAISTAKYASEELSLPINVEERLRERKVGILGINNERFLKETQEHDFEYKLHNGEALNTVKERMRQFLKEVLNKHEDEMILIFTHDIAIESLLSIWCDKGFNLENHLILNYKNNVIIDGAFHPFNIFKLEFEEDKIRNIEWCNEKEL